jgi:hypothetical protein
MKQPLHRLEATSLHASSAVLPGRSTFQGPQAAPPAARFGVGCTAPERHRFGGSIRGYPNGWLVYFMENPNLKGMIQGYHEVPRSFGNLHVSFKAIQTRHGTENG